MSEPLGSARERLAGLYGRPGFMIRRLHQISIAVFNAHAGALGLTDTQFGLLYVLARYPLIDQVTLARLMRLDRSTTGTVIETLEGRGLVLRQVGRPDRRRRVLLLTPEGEAMLERVQNEAAGTSDTLLATLSAEERLQFEALLGRVIAHFESADGATEITLPSRS
jgi:DNA-binding MarR family transcriptional regulator